MGATVVRARSGAVVGGLGSTGVAFEGEAPSLEVGTAAADTKASLVSRQVSAATAEATVPDIVPEPSSARGGEALGNLFTADAALLSLAPSVSTAARRTGAPLAHAFFTGTVGV